MRHTRTRFIFYIPPSGNRIVRWNECIPVIIVYIYHHVQTAKLAAVTVSHEEPMYRHWLVNSDISDSLDVIDLQ